MGAIAQFYGGGRNCSWLLSSKEDPRWNCSGRGGNNVVKEKLRELEERYGQQPNDLRINVVID